VPVSFPTMIYVLAALTGLVIVLTRVRLSQAGPDRGGVPEVVVHLHTMFGVLGLGLWLTYLWLPKNGALEVGILALGCLWIVAACGLLIMMRWLPSKGRHSTPSSEDRWSDGPGLSVLAHLGMLAGVFIETYAYMFALV
jgi:hypothetical protein